MPVNVLTNTCYQSRPFKKKSCLASFQPCFGVVRLQTVFWYNWFHCNENRSDRTSCTRLMLSHSPTPVAIISYPGGYRQPSLHFFRSLAAYSVTLILFASNFTWYLQRLFGLSGSLLPSVFWFHICFVITFPFNDLTNPLQPPHCVGALNGSHISLLCWILQISLTLVGPNFFLRILFSKLPSLFSVLMVNIHMSVA